jgi:hypothetical protein
LFSFALIFDEAFVSICCNNKPSNSFRNSFIVGPLPLLPAGRPSASSFKIETTGKFDLVVAVCGSDRYVSF